MNLDDGQTIHTNHDSCGDKRRRLYFTREGRYVLYICHNCGYKGKTLYKNLHKLYSESGKGKAWGEARTHECKLPSDSEPDPLMWPKAARDWLCQYDSEASDVVKMRAVYSPSWERVVFPVYDGDGLMFINARDITGNHPRKWLLYKRSTLAVRPYAIYNGNKNTLVICEDMLSAYKINKAGFTGLAAMGTALDYHALNLIKFTNPDRVLVFLDNDNREVKRAQNKLKKHLDLMLQCPVEIVRSDRDPKEHTLRELEAICG